MSASELSPTELAVLQAVHGEGSADLYDLARTVGIGPRAVQESVRSLARADYVHVTGRHVACTAGGDEVARTHLSGDPQDQTATPRSEGSSE